MMKVKQFSWPMVLGCTTIIFLIFCVLPNYFSSIVKKEVDTPSQQSPPSSNAVEKVDEPISRCYVPGLENIEQYRAYLHKPETTCNNLRQFGGKPPAPADGKKFVCMDDRFRIKPRDCLVFSFGINNEWSFEDEFDKFGCKVYAYDPTMGKQDHQRSPNIRFLAKGIGNYRGTKKVGMGDKWSVQKVDRFENLVQEVGWEGREIDYVKLDVELSEIDFLQDMLFNSPHALAKIKQIGMEVHDGPVKDLHQTSRQQVFWMYFMLLRCAGFKLIHSRDAGGWREVVWARDY